MSEILEKLRPTTMHMRRYRIVVLAVLTIMALSTRLLPLAISQYPFNNDSINECRISDDILASGHLSYPQDSYYADSQSVVTPVYNVLLAYCSAVVGSSTFSLAQIVVAVLSVVALVGIYLVSLQITGDSRAAMCASFVLALFGTFVYLTASGWKEAAGIPLLILLIYSYMNRAQPRMLALVIILLCLLPLTHHLVAIIGYFTLVCMTIWSIFFALMRRSVHRRHVVDIAVIGVFSSGALAYYLVNSMDGFSYVDTGLSFLMMVVSFVVLTVAGLVALYRRSHIRQSFAWIPAVVAAGLFLWNHYSPLFPYSQSEPDTVLILGVVTAVLIGLAWLGWEMMLEGSSKFRAIPFGLLVSVMTIILFALISDMDLGAHKILYRTFDLADLSLALGVSVAVAGLATRPRRQSVVVACLIIVLLVSFPFGIVTGSLVGVRHDTQGYEVDAIEWTYVSAGADAILQSDERLAYTSRVLYDFEKNAGLPSVLSEERLPRLSAINMMLEEWMSVGVNDYPYGHHTLNETFISYCLLSSNVYYVSGPASNNLWLFQVSELAVTSIPQ